jgi:hypothetical protein
MGPRMHHTILRSRRRPTEGPNDPNGDAGAHSALRVSESSLTSNSDRRKHDRRSASGAPGKWTSVSKPRAELFPRSSPLLVSPWVSSYLISSPLLFSPLLTSALLTRRLSPPLLGSRLLASPCLSYPRFPSSTIARLSSHSLYSSLIFPSPPSSPISSPRRVGPHLPGISSSSPDLAP